jgi:hypothetical protein
MGARALIPGLVGRTASMCREPWGAGRGPERVASPWEVGNGDGDGNELAFRLVRLDPPRAGGPGTPRILFGGLIPRLPMLYTEVGKEHR